MLKDKKDLQSSNSITKATGAGPSLERERGPSFSLETNTKKILHKGDEGS